MKGKTMLERLLSKISKTKYDCISCKYSSFLDIPRFEKDNPGWFCFFSNMTVEQCRRSFNLSTCHSARHKKNRGGKPMMLSSEEVLIIEQLRSFDWGKLTVIKKNGDVVMITPAPDIKVSKD